jgi:hypothetical protein
MNYNLVAIQLRVFVKRVCERTGKCDVGDPEHRIRHKRLYRCGHDFESRRGFGCEGSSTCYCYVPVLFPPDVFQTYIFEVAEVVPDPNTSSKRWYKLRLHCRDEAKGPVTAVCGMNGYLVSSMGQKVRDLGITLSLSNVIVVLDFRSRV